MNDAAGNTRTSLQRLTALGCITLLMVSGIVPGLVRAAHIHAAAYPYHVTLTASNFGQNLFAAALDFSNPGHAVFSLQNGTPLWYAISAQSTPGGLTPAPANANDAVTTGFYAETVPLLPADDALPPDYTSGQQQIPALLLAVAFVGPGEQEQITLNAFEPHATLMDVLTLLLHLLGEQATGIQIGLLAPGVLPTIFNSVTSMRYLQSLANDYALLLQAALSQGNASGLWQAAYSCSRDLVGLVSDTAERVPLANMLWLALGKTIPMTSLLATLSAFGDSQFGLGILGYLKDEALSIGGTLFQQNNPTLTLQSATNVTLQPTLTSTTKPTSTSTPKPTPTSIPKKKP